MRIKILRSARHDLREGYVFYEAKEPGLGEYFLSSLQADIEGLRVSAGIHRVVHREFHRMVCRTFPFAVYYTRQKDISTVFAVVARNACPELPNLRLSAKSADALSGVVGDWNRSWMLMDTDQPSMSVD